MASVVAQWTGRELKALRLARRLSQRRYAAHLGLSDVALSAAERKGAAMVFRMETQEILDTDLEQASESVRERFWLLLEEQPDADLAAVSATRTASATALPRWHVPDEAGTAALQEFVASGSRAFVLCGPAGTGKSTLVQSAVTALVEVADVQVHPGAEASPTDLAAAVLRYGSIPVGEDALLTLERTAESLSRPLVVIVDGINLLGSVGRAVDTILRQAAAPALRFLLVIRTPPAPDLSGYPLLAASVFRPSNGAPKNTLDAAQ